jgi:hypothetical protein
MSTTLTDVATFITSEATEDDIARIYEFCKQRNKTLRTIRAASVQTGAAVELSNLSPKYLNGLTGTVSTITKDRCAVLLDEESTSTLKWSGRGRFVVGEQANYTLNGVPLSSCKVREA